MNSEYKRKSYRFNTIKSAGFVYHQFRKELHIIKKSLLRHHRIIHRIAHEYRQTANRQSI